MVEAKLKGPKLEEANDAPSQIPKEVSDGMTSPLAKVFNRLSESEW